jgi:hypothetical protein
MIGAIGGAVAGYYLMPYIHGDKNRRGGMGLDFIVSQGMGVIVGGVVGHFFIDRRR